LNSLVDPHEGPVLGITKANDTKLIKATRTMA
jgi:hypothetical protein